MNSLKVHQDIRQSSTLPAEFYESGRFSPEMEKAVHHFHALMAKLMSK